MGYPIDIVIPWVDGSDPAWRAERAKYDPSATSDNSEERFRDWDTFRYWFRCIEKNAPWVRTIHFVTWGHLPGWLDPSHPKLHIVNHRDFIPEEYLPAFSSHVIELNMHRIPDLAEHFLYFNDDVFLVQKAKRSDFFRNGLPVDSAILGVIKNADTDNFLPYIELNMLGILNHRFDKREVVRKAPLKWFHPAYGKGLLLNLYLSAWGIFPGFRNLHTAYAYRKSVLRAVWEEAGEALDATCRHRFRSKEDVNQYIFRYWQLAKGEFAPGRLRSAYLTIGRPEEKRLAAVLNDPKKLLVCLNDDPIGFDFEEEQKYLCGILGEHFPEKSAFER